MFPHKTHKNRFPFFDIPVEIRPSGRFQSCCSLASASHQCRSTLKHELATAACNSGSQPHKQALRVDRKHTMKRLPPANNEWLTATSNKRQNETEVHKWQCGCGSDHNLGCFHLTSLSKPVNLDHSNKIAFVIPDQHHLKNFNTSERF